jgi:hypothetical protein
MKKRLEAELISIAHRILKLKNKSEIDQLYKETQKLYDTLAVLKFYHENFESIKSDMSVEILEEKLEQFNATIAEKEPEVKAETVEPAHEVEEEVIAEPETQKEEETATDEEHEEAVVSEEPESVEEESLTDEKISFEPSFQLETEEEEVEPEVLIPTKEETKKVALEHFLGENYVDPVFVKPNEVSLFSSEQKSEEKEEPIQQEQKLEIKEEPKVEAPKTAAMNDAMSKSIAIGLNDRIGFVQHLFNDSNEDFNRVISQLNTFNTFEEAKNFINEMVIPDYNYWVGEEDYIERFMAIVEKKFT